MHLLQILLVHRLSKEKQSWISHDNILQLGTQ